MRRQGTGRLAAPGGGLALVLGLAVLAGGADDARAQERRQELVARFQAPEIVEKLKSGGYVLLMRHMATVPEPDDWGGVDYEDCSTQRILSAEGRRQARALGKAFDALSIPVGTVHVSPYCRCQETAKLAFDHDGEASETLSVWDELSMEEKTQRGIEIRKMLDTPPEPGTNSVLITHTGNLLWSFGLDSKPEGLTHVFKPTGLSLARPTYIGRVDPEEWRTLAGLPVEPLAQAEVAEGGEAEDPPEAEAAGEPAPEASAE